MRAARSAAVSTEEVGLLLGVGSLSCGGLSLLSGEFDAGGFRVGSCSCTLLGEVRCGAGVVGGVEGSLLASLRPVVPVNADRAAEIVGS